MAAAGDRPPGRRTPATAGLVDDPGDAAHRLAVRPGRHAAARSSGASATDDGALVHDFTDPDLDTRFLGDLYQDLSEHAKKTYALLQTPEFVEEFILDRTLEPALAERPLEGFKMIDPACGSGHFLLGAFRRILDRWHAEAPGLGARDRVQKALDAVWGVDINPFAVAIARFRLTVAALQRRRTTTLARRTRPASRIHVLAGDSLWFSHDQDALFARQGRLRLLHRGQGRPRRGARPAASTTPSSRTRPTSRSRTRRSTPPTASGTTTSRASTH